MVVDVVGVAVVEVVLEVGVDDVVEVVGQAKWPLGLHVAGAAPTAPPADTKRPMTSAGMATMRASSFFMSLPFNQANCSTTANAEGPKVWILPLE